MSSGRILVTGGAGYIGSHTSWACLDAGHEVVVLDDLSTGVEACIPDKATFVKGGIEDLDLVAATLKKYQISAILHFAGRIVVPESVENPIKYYKENTLHSFGLLATATNCGVGNFIFSSTAAVYAPPADGEMAGLKEDDLTEPLSPYGQSKLMTEHMIRDIGIAHGLNSVVLRYFNVAGADPHGRTGQSTPNATHLIKVASQTALGQRDKMALYGNDYPTPDGTCIRDYIHVTDLASAHVHALEKLLASGGQYTMNCGYGRGSSVFDVVKAVEGVTGASLPVEIVGRRAGDAPCLISNNKRILETLPWKPQHDSLEEMVSSALTWERTLAANAA